MGYSGTHREIVLLTEFFCTNQIENPNLNCLVKVPCTLARQPGPCRGYIERFYFDDKEKKCLPFVYGGCQGEYYQITLNSQRLCHGIKLIYILKSLTL